MTRTTFDRFLHNAWSSWYNLTGTVGPDGSDIDFDDVQPRLLECAEAITSAVAALRTGSIDETHRNTIDRILNGEKDEESIPNLPSLRELLETCENTLNIGEREESDRAIWNATAEEVRVACDRLAQTISSSDGR